MTREGPPHEPPTDAGPGRETDDPDTPVEPLAPWLDDDEPAARARLAQLEAIYENAPLGLCILDTELRYVRINERLAEINGIPAEAHVGRTVREVVPDLAEQAEARMREVLDSGVPLLDVQIAGETPSQPGARRSWSESFLPLRDHEGRIVGLTVIARETTEELRARQRIREEEQRVRDVLQLLPAGMYMCDADGVITFYNDRAAEIWGRTPDPEDTERRFCGALRLYWPDGTPLAHHETPMAEAVRSGAAYRNREVLMERPDGSRVQVSVNIDPVRGPGGAVVGAVNVFTDVTSLRATQEALELSEARDRELVEGVRAAIIRWRRDGRITFANPYAEEVFGYGPGELAGRHVAVLLPPLEVSNRDLSGLIADIIDNPEHYAHIVHENVTRGGGRRWFAWTNRPVLDADGRALEVLAVGLDITEQKLAEEDLLELTETLEEQVVERTALAERRARQLQALAVEVIEAEEEERGRIAELLHDDLQQLLAGARLQLGAAARSLDAGSKLEGVDSLLEEALAASRKLSHHLSPAVLQHAGLRAAMEWLARDMEEQFDLEVELELDISDDGVDRAITTLAFRAAQELLFNVVKHASAVRARLEVERTDGLLVLAVSDDGRGFDPETVTSSQLPEGFGLLKLQERVAAIGGEVTIASRPGDGSRITVRLPVRLADAEAADEAVPVPNGGTVAETTRLPGDEPGSFRLLVVDDHQVMRQGLVSMFADQPGLTVVGEAANGLEAVELCQRLRPDVVVMDISMPVMDGIEATRRITQELPGLRVIGLSMHDDHGVARAMQEAGAEAFVSKTVSSAELLQVIYGLYDGSG